MEQVKRHLGHATIRVTSDRYGHLFEGHDEALLERLDERFREARVSPACHASGLTAVASRAHRA